MFNVILIHGASILVYIKVMIIEEVMAVIPIRTFVGVNIVVNIGTQHMFFTSRNIKRISLADFCSYRLTAGDR